MATIQAQATSSSALTPGSTVIRAIPTVGFKVDGIEAVAGKVNGGAQYIFKVEFNPDPSAPASSPKFTADIPLHASSMEKALAMLHVFASEVAKTKNHAEFHEMMEKMKYSAVLFDSVPGSKDGDYKVSFSEYDATTRTFKDSHIDSVVKGSVHKDLKQYAEILESQHQDLFPSPAVHPQVSLHPSTAPVSVNLTVTPSPSLSTEWAGHKDNMRRYFNEVTVNPLPSEQDHKNWMEFLDKKVFFKENRFTEIAKRSDIAVITKDLCDEVRREIQQYQAAHANLTYATVPEGSDADAFLALVEWYINKPVETPQVAATIIPPESTTIHGIIKGSS